MNNSGYQKKILSPTGYASHRDEEYNQTGFDMLWDMQDRHFWYRGRHRFLLKAPDRFMLKTHSLLRTIDLGGEGGRMHYLADRRGEHSQKIALADSSHIALTMASNILPQGVDCYQIGLINLVWKDGWKTKTHALKTYTTAEHNKTLMACLKLREDTTQ